MTSDDRHLPGMPEAGCLDGYERVKLSRRTVCSLGAGLSAIALLGLPEVRAFAAQRYDIRYVLTDKRYAQSMVFGNSLLRQGSTRLEITDGLTRLWLDALVPLWRRKEGAIAGLTLRETWVCVAEQARSCGRRSVLVGRHALAADGNVTNHTLSAPRIVLNDAATLVSGKEQWPHVMARLITQCPTNDRCPASAEQFQSSSAAVAAPSAHLVSWIIA